MRKKIFTFLLALAASVGMMNAKVTWKSCNISDLNVMETNVSYSKEGVTLRAKADEIYARWYDFEDESMDGIRFMMDATGGYTFSNTLGKNFTKIEMTLNGPAGWDYANLGNGWNIVGDPWNGMKAIWTGNASKVVNLLEDESHFHGENVKRIEFYFEGDSEAPDPTYTVALQDGTANADKVTLSATSAEECTTVTVTPNEEYVITAFKATYNTTEELSTSFNAETDAYSFKMPAADVTIEATIALKLVPEGDIFSGFTATAGAGGFTNEGSANLVDNKFISSDWTKWCADNSYKSVPTGESGDACWWIDFEASEALNPTGYILTTGNDTGNEHGRNPKNWVLKAKLNADDAWTTIATVTNDVTMKNKSFKDYKFFVDQSGTYQYFRFEVFANQGANVMQLCELRLIGTEPVLVTTHTLQLHVNDGVMGSVALQNPSNDIVDNGDGTYTVPEGATVTLIATPNEGYEFIGWKASSSICDFNECEFVALPTNDNPLTFDMNNEVAFMAEFAAVAPTNPEIKLNGKFSVADDKVVCFSKGNLQATTADNGTTWTWAFAADQLTFIGDATANTAINGNGTVSANGTVDLFGWSTAATKYGINNSLSNSTYSGDFVDWGSNPDLIASLGEGWRTLTSAEWTYLLNTRTTTSGVRYAKAIVDGKNGLIILPDDWSESYHALASANTGDAAYTYNIFDAAIWSSDFEAHGAVFLPAAGYRRGKDVEHLGVFANYWSASPDGAEYAYYLSFNESLLYPAYNYNRVTGEAVRLVSDIAPAPQPQTAVEIGDQNNAEEVTAFLTTNDGQTIDELIIDRPVLNNMYNTLCLPFDMNATQIAASSLNGVEIREFTGASVEGTTLNLSVGDPVNAVVAGRPYFVKYSAASQLDDLHFEDVTINNALLDNMAVTFDGVTFKGTFTPFVMPNGLNFQGGYLFLGQNNQLFWPNTSNPLKPFRAYFYVDVESSTPSNAPKYRGMPARIVEGKNVATGVENAQSANQSTKVIVNGQLIIIKNDVRYNAQGQVVK